MSLTGEPSDLHTEKSGLAQETIPVLLREHEARSQHRFEQLRDCLYEMKGGETMSSGEEKVEVHNKFMPGHGGGDGGIGIMGAIAALGGRNERGYGGDGFGFGGGGGMGALLALALLGGRGFGRDGFDGRGGDCCNQLGQQILLSKVGTVEGAVPLAASTVQNAICESTATIQGGIGALALGTQQGFANVKDTVQNLSTAQLIATAGVKDAVQNGFFLTSNNMLEGFCNVKQNDNANTDRILAALNSRWTAEDQARIVSQQNEITELRQEHRRSRDHDELKLQITNTNTAVAAQAQGQQQAQFQGLVASVNSLFPILQGVLQVAHATNSNVIAGNTGAVVTGPQTANPTNVNA